MHAEHCSTDLSIHQFDFSVLTHRRTVLDPSKLDYINKHHLMQLMSKPEGLQKLAECALPYVREVYPDRCVDSFVKASRGTNSSLQPTRIAGIHWAGHLGLAGE